MLLQKAEFNPIVKTYLLLNVAFVLCATVAGIPLALIWVCGVGQWWASHYFAKMSCELEERNLHFKQGIFVQVEKTIPLDTIQDLTFVEGPILRYFNLCILKVETAGKGESGYAGFGNEMSLLGIVNPQDFRARVLAQRELILDRKHSSGAVAVQTDALLAEIRDLLQEIRDKKTGL
jgi:putative membrane protein